MQLLVTNIEIQYYKSRVEEITKMFFYSPQMFEANLKPTLFFFLRRFVKIKNIVLCKCQEVFGRAWACLFFLDFIKKLDEKL